VTLPRNRLPNGTPISSFGLGCSSYWAKHSYPAGQAVALVQRAYALGINHFDTGPSYEAGEAERRLGTAIRGLDRESLVISTKAGTYCDADGRKLRSFEPARIRAGVLESLTRLGLARIDVLYLHGPSVRDLSTEVIECLQELKAGGAVTYSGVNSFDRAVLARLVDLPMDMVMPQYNVFDVSCAAEIEALKRAGKTIISGTALGQGVIDFQALLPTDKKSLWYLLRKVKNDPLFPLTRWRARRRFAAAARSPLEAALLFLLKSTAITSSVFGTTSIAHLEENVAAAARMGALR
jgi:aryl-alcohol dehydrogenase-like predicted oxidoreductase